MNEKDSLTDPIDTIQEAQEFLRLAAEAESDNRSRALEDIKFSYGEQWPVEIQNSRQLEARPMLTLNKTGALCRQVENQQRQQRPRIKVDPTGGEATVKVGETIQGMIRHIENSRSGGDLAYDNAFSYALRGGFGYFRILTDYVNEKSFDQEIFLSMIENPFSVYRDPNSYLPDGSDSMGYLITSKMHKSQFRQKYPDADEANWTERASGDSDPDWVTKEDIRVAEMFKVELKSENLLLLSDKTTAWESELPDNELLARTGLSIIDERRSYRRKVYWCKLTSMQVLEEKYLPGRYIPVIPVYGSSVVIDNRRKYFGMVHDAKDPQRMFNFWRTATTESIALAPKAKWIIAAGQDEGYENEWAQANIKASAVLHYNQRDVKGETAPPPQRQQPEPPPEGAMAAAMQIGEDLMSILGVVDPAMRITGPISGKALNAQAQQSQNSAFHFYDNLTRSMRHAGRIILEYVPIYYSEERMVRIVGEDGRAKLLKINERTAADTIKNDLTVGEYDVVMDTGPGYDTKRQAAVDGFNELLGSPLGEEIAKVGADLVVRLHDAPGMDTLADRLAAANPLAQLNEESDIPPQIQIKLKQAQVQIQQLTQANQQLEQEIKLKTGIEKMKQDEETKREHMRSVTKIHNNDADNVAWAHDVQTKALTAQNVEELKGVVQLMLHHLGAKEAKEIAEITSKENTEVTEK